MISDIMIDKESISALFQYANEGILIINEKGEILKANPSIEKMFGHSIPNLIGEKIEILIPNRYSEAHQHHRSQYNENPKPRSMGKGANLYALHKNGKEFPVEVSLSHYEHNNRKFVIAFVIDITERKESEEKIKNHSIELEKQVNDRTLVLREAIFQLEKTKEELNNALLKEKELNDMKSRFVSMASHEFRTPLATILSSLSLIKTYYEQQNIEKSNKHILRVKSAVNNMTDILNDFLSLSKLEEGKIAYSPERFDLKALLEDVVQEMQNMSKQGQTISYSHSGEKKEVVLDKKLVRNILFNLISNAIKFSSENKNIKIKSEINKKETILCIVDNGIGISKEDQKHLFERFYRGQNATNIQGTGLGLNIVSKYVELMNGNIEYNSTLNEGTTFVIKFQNK